MGTDKGKKSIYDIQYAREHLKRVPLDVQRAYFDNVIKTAADRAGLPVNAWIKQAIAEKIEREAGER